MTKPHNHPPQRKRMYMVSVRVQVEGGGGARDLAINDLAALHRVVLREKTLVFSCQECISRCLIRTLLKSRGLGPLV